jgi:hypothetical protein
MTIANPPKALIALVALICITILIAVRAIDANQGLPIITLVTGYAVGNGLASAKGQPVQPIIGPKNHAN